MRVVLFLLFLSIGSIASSAQDFVSRYYEECKEDTAVKRISISPRMMEEILKSQSKVDNQEEMMDIISELKTMQVLSSKSHVNRHFRKANQMLQRNNNRFQPFASYESDQEDCQISIRKKKGIIIELVMLLRKEDDFRIINFTGNMNQDFINQLIHMMASHS